MGESNSHEILPKHLLLELAKTYPKGTQDLTPPGCRYDVLQGAWLLNSVGTLLVESDERPPPKTKKADMETGEDQKSE